MARKQNPSRYDRKGIIKNSNFNSDLIADKVAELDIGSKHSTESKDSVRDVPTANNVSRKNLGSKRASTNLNYQHSPSPSGNSVN